MPERYKSSFGPDTPYANVVGLVGRHRPPSGGIVVDVGCGYGLVAEPLSQLGVGYLGLDMAADGLADLEGRGFETVEADLTNPLGWVEDVTKALDGRPIAAVLALDVIEHMATPGDLVGSIRELVERAGPAPLVVSVPNVAHLDLGVKLLVGRWDVTPIGLLDATHLSLYTEARLTQDLARGGWLELDRADFHLTWSDQHEPEDFVPLNKGTALGAFLHQIREGADANATVNQFVRAYTPVPPHGQSVSGEQTATGQTAHEVPFLSVIVRAEGKGTDSLAERLHSLAAQTCQDFEVLVMAHDLDPDGVAAVRQLVQSFPPGAVSRSRVIPVRGGGRARPLNAGVLEARGRYAAILDDNELAFDDWVESFQRVALAHPGQIVRTGVSSEHLARLEHAPTGAMTTLDGTDVGLAGFELLSHLLDNWTAPCGLAFPRSCFSDLGLRFDEHLPVLDHWDLLLRASQYCGVVPTRQVTGLSRRGVTEPTALDTSSQDEWKAAKATIIANLERRPFLLSADSLSQVRDAINDRRSLAGLEEELAARDDALAEIQAQLEALDRARADAEARYDEIKASRSWRATRVLRGAGWLARKIKQTRILGGRPRPR